LFGHLQIALCQDVNCAAASSSVNSATGGRPSIGDGRPRPSRLRGRGKPTREVVLRSYSRCKMRSDFECTTYRRRCIDKRIFELRALTFHCNSSLSGYLIGCERTYLGMFRCRQTAHTRGEAVEPWEPSAICDRFRDES